MTPEVRSARRGLMFGVRIAALVLFALAVAGCGLNRRLARQADAIVTQTRPADVTCSRDDRCAIDSPYRALIDDARAASTPATPVHYVNVLEVGEDSLLLRVHLIRAARKSIDIQTFIWAEDDAAAAKKISEGEVGEEVKVKGDADA